MHFQHYTNINQLNCSLSLFDHKTLVLNETLTNILHIDHSYITLILYSCEIEAMFYLTQ